MKPLSTNTSRSHTARAWIRVAGATIELKCRRRYRPPATQANAAEPWACSAKTQAMYGARSVMAISLKLSCVSPKTQRATTPTTSPTAMPQGRRQNEVQQCVAERKSPTDRRRNRHAIEH